MAFSFDFEYVRRGVKRDPKNTNERVCCKKTERKFVSSVSSDKKIKTEERKETLQKERSLQTTTTTT